MTVSKDLQHIFFAHSIHNYSLLSSFSSCGKKVITKIRNDDHLCFHRAFAVAWAKAVEISQKEWKELVADDKLEKPSISNLDLILRHRRCPESHFKELTRKFRIDCDGNEVEPPYQLELAIALAKLANVDINKPGGLSNVRQYEDAFNVNIVVLGFEEECDFITPAYKDMTKIFLLYSPNHFDAITRISGFFTGSYFTPILHSNQTGVCRIGNCVYWVVLIPVCNFAISYP